MLEASGLEIAQVPAVLEGIDIAGAVRPDVATDLGLPAVPVAAGAGDNAAGAVGAGVIGPGMALLSLGTSGVLLHVSDRPQPNTAAAVHAFCHAFPGRWQQMAVILSAASCLEWVARLAGFPDVATALTAAERASHAAVPVFLPYLAGERTPHDDPGARGVFAGMSLDTDRECIVRAVLEGVAFALADGIGALRAGGARIDVTSVVGGGARSDFWGRIIATALDARLQYRAGAEVGPALGAARIARIAMGAVLPEEVAIPGPLTHEIPPDLELADQLEQRRRVFTGLYPALRAIRLSDCAQC